jgi:hypothetical protein
MKNIQIMSKPLVVIFLTFVFLLASCSSPVEADNSNYSEEIDIAKVLETMEIGNITPEEVEGLIFMREEEKLAKDVYLTMFEKWEMKIFENISKSEEKHTNAVKILLERYSIEDPVQADEIGVFTNSELQELYNSLVERGNSSLIEALKVGAAIEEIDIMDLEKQINGIVNSEDILFVYNNLLKGSQNHLRAFVRNISSQGETYTPQYMNSETYQEIINSDMQNGKKGKGKKRNGNKKF